MLHLLQMGPFTVLTTFFFWNQNSWQLSLLELSPLLGYFFFWRSHTYQHCNFLLGLLHFVYLHCSIWPIWPSLLTQHTRPTLAFKPFVSLPPTFYLLPMHSHHRLMLQAVFLHLLLPLCPLTPLGFFNRMQGGLRAGALNLNAFFCLIPLTLFVSMILTLISFLFLDSLLCNLIATHSRFGIFSPDATLASGGVIIFVRQGLSFSELSTSSLSLLDPYF